jgi:AraC family transcriptional regulator of adaptative response / DNA-3-methyladenine glycosylase II
LNEGAASYIAMRSLGEPDAFPHTDLGLRQALSIRGRPVSPAELLCAFKKFTPWRAYAAMHFLAALPKTSRPTDSPEPRVSVPHRSRQNIASPF